MAKNITKPFQVFHHNILRTITITQYYLLLIVYYIHTIYEYYESILHYTTIYVM